MTVAELLAASRASHAAYRQVHSEGWQAGLWDARYFRSEALRLDPSRLDPAWSLDKASHEALMAFYDHQLGLDR